VGEPIVNGDHKIALVAQHSGKKDVRSDLTGDRNTSDVGCEGHVPQAYSVPCPPPTDYTTVMCVFGYWFVGCACLEAPS